MKAKIFINEVAGNGTAKRVAAKLKQELSAMNIPYSYYVSVFPGDLVQQARKYAASLPEPNEKLIVVGADGTFNEVLNGIKASPNPNLPLAYLPAGTGNDFGRAASLSKDPAVLLHELINDEKPQCVDCGYYQNLKDRGQKGYFVNNFGIGFDAYVVQKSNHDPLKKRLNNVRAGNLIYGANIISALIHQQTFRVTVKTGGKQVSYDDVYFATTTNHPYFGGGIAILPQANIFSGKLDTVIVEKPSLAKFTHLFGKLLKYGSQVNDPHFHYIEAEEIVLKCPQLEYGQIDGEDLKQQRFALAFKLAHFYLWR